MCVTKNLLSRLKEKLIMKIVNISLVVIGPEFEGGAKTGAQGTERKYYKKDETVVEQGETQKENKKIQQESSKRKKGRGETEEKQIEVKYRSMRKRGEQEKESVGRDPKGVRGT